MDLFTPTQAAAATGLPLKAIQKAIDLGTVPIHVKKAGRNKTRYLSNAALLCLHLEASGLHDLPLSMRKDIFKRISRSPQVRQVRINDVVVVDIGSARKKLTRRLKDLKKAEQMVSS